MYSDTDVEDMSDADLADAIMGVDGQLAARKAEIHAAIDPATGYAPRMAWAEYQAWRGRAVAFKTVCAREMQRRKRDRKTDTVQAVARVVHLWVSGSICSDEAMKRVAEEMRR